MRYNLWNGNGNYRSDIYDGAVYQEQMASGFLSNQSNISFILNTDGVPVFRSSSFSFISSSMNYDIRWGMHVCVTRGIWRHCGHCLSENVIVFYWVLTLGINTYSFNLFPMVDKGLITGESKIWAHIVVRVANALGFASSNLSPSWLHYWCY